MSSANAQAVDKLNGELNAGIAKDVQEYISLHTVNDSPVSSERFNKVDKRNDAIGAVRDGLEGIIKSTTGDRIYPDRAKADAIIENLVTEGYRAKEPHFHVLPEEAKAKEEKVMDYLKEAGVDYTQLRTQTISNRRGTKTADLPDGHPLKALVDYVVNHTEPEQRRLQFIQDKLLSMGQNRAHAEIIARAFNEHAGLRLDTRYATVPEALQTFQQYVQTQVANYRANEPDKVQNLKLSDVA